MFGRHKKQQNQSGRRRPIGGPQTASFAAYYASKRSSLPASRGSDNEIRKSPSSTPKVSRLNKFLQRQKTDDLGQRIGKLLLVLVLVACTISLLQIDTSPRVVVLDNAASSYALHTTAEYQQVVTTALRGSLLNSNKITINTRSIVTQLKQKFPEIYDASVVLPLVGHRPTVYVELAQPAIALRSPTSYIVVDNSGRALLVAASTSVNSEQQLPTVTDNSVLNLHVGDIALSSGNVAFIKDAVAQFAAQHVGINKMVLPAGAEELDIYPAGVKYYVKFNLHETTSREQAGTYFATRQQLTRPGAAKPKQYVDVRLVGRAYVL